MKAYTKEFIAESSIETLKAKRDELNKVIERKTIEWVNSKGDTISVPWAVFNPNGAVKVSREEFPREWDLGRRVQIRAEAERQNSGNAIASFNCKLQAKPNALTATVKCNGLSRTRCPVCDQLAEALSYLGNAQKVSREIFDREDKERQLDLAASELRTVKEQDEERKAVAASEKARVDAEKAKVAEAKAKAEKAVKDAFKAQQPAPEGNGQPLVPAGV